MQRLNGAKPQNINIINSIRIERLKKNVEAKGKQLTKFKEIGSVHYLERYSAPSEGRFWPLGI